jgi:hypothetical protein
LNTQRGSFSQDRDDRSLGCGEVTDHRNDRGHEGALRLVGHRGLLTIEQRNLRGLQDVAAAISLSCLQQEEDFDVAENRESEVGRRGRIESTELRYRRSEAVLGKPQVKVRCRVPGVVQPDQRLGPRVIREERRSRVQPDLSSMSKSKSIPIRSKKSSFSVMKRTSIVTCRSIRRRN